MTPQDLIASINRASNVVTAVVNSLQGLTIGAEITVAGVVGTATDFNGGPFTITGVTPNLGGGGTITWAQSGTDDTGTGYTGVGVVAPTGAGIGTNLSEIITYIARQNNQGAAAFCGGTQPHNAASGIRSGCDYHHRGRDGHFV